MKGVHYTFLTVFVAIALSIVGCRKKEDTIAIIHVRDSVNTEVPNARVILYGKGSEPGKSVVLFDTTYTDLNGEASFNFNDVYQLGQAGVAVLDIHVLKDGVESEGIIKVEEETTTEETVFINI